jgi:pyruvate/2-oxoglutarate dehydrogenase complex dihydrolipoamide dehydrogenase (E3) component
MICFALLKFFHPFVLDSQVRDFLAEQMSLRGIMFHTEQTPQAITKSNDGSLSLKTSKETIAGLSHVMFATGRRPNTMVIPLYTCIFSPLGLILVDMLILISDILATLVEPWTGRGWG